MENLKYVRRSAKGWSVNMWRGKKNICKYFSDKKYGGYDSARNQATLYRDNILNGIIVHTKKSSFDKHIYRSGDGWEFVYSRKGEKITKRFADGLYMFDKDLSLLAAQKFRDRYLNLTHSNEAPTWTTIEVSSCFISEI